MAKKKAMWALILMKELRFDAPLPWTQKPLYDWFRDLVGGVSFRSTGLNSCCSPGFVINVVYTQNDTTPTVAHSASTTCS
jgi:hypothetical protein